MRKALFAAAAACLASQSAAQAPAQPKLLVVISVDQFSADLFDEYRPQFTGGLARLATGTLYRNGYQSHATTETCPGHSTILTGDHPARTGIVANAWADYAAPRADKIVYCAEDEKAPGTSSTNYKVSPLHLRVPTLGELMKRQWPSSLNVAVAGKDRSAIMMGGHLADQRWYWDGKKFATDNTAAVVPRTMVRLNEAIGPILAAPSEGLEPPPYCAGKSQVIPIEGGGKPVGGGRLARAAGDAAAFRASPDFDGTVLAAAAGLIQELYLGTHAAPDVISIGLSATDYVGHGYGTGGQEMCLQLLELDREIGDFLAQLDRWHLNYVVALTADHGGLDVPERLRAQGVADAARVDPALTPKNIGEAVTRQTGIAGPILVNNGVSGDLYLDPHLKGPDRKRALDAAVALYRAHPQVAAAFSKNEVAATPVPTGDPVKWSVIERVRASFDGERSGDLYVVLKPHIMPIADTTTYVATHGSPWDYDRRVPILFWRPSFVGQTLEQPAETTDIMPTLASMIGFDVAPGSVDGHCLGGAAGYACPPR
jgi:predicted AlkP superfamily pyrophosphatase or phosphodiesterase